MSTPKQAFRKIGNAFVPPIGFGAMGVSLAYGPVDSDEERFKVCNYTDLILDYFFLISPGARRGLRTRLYTLGYR